MVHKIKEKEKEILELESRNHPSITVFTDEETGSVFYWNRASQYRAGLRTQTLTLNLVQSHMDTSCDAFILPHDNLQASISWFMNSVAQHQHVLIYLHEVLSSVKQNRQMQHFAIQQFLKKFS